MSDEPQGQGVASSITKKQLLESGVHFGHQSRRWNPKMRPYIYTERNNIYIIDLKKTLKMLRDACNYVRDQVAEGKTLLFVGTKKQAKESIRDAANACGMYHVNSRWLGGMLTNFRTVRRSVLHLLELDRAVQDGTIAHYSKKEQSRILKERARLEKNLAGVKMMDRLPDMVFVVDPHKEHIAVREAQKCRIPVIAIVDTNCDPDPIDMIIPGNDDAIRAIKLISEKMSESAREGAMIRSETVGYGQTMDQPPMATPQASQAPGQAPLPTPGQELLELSARYTQYQADESVTEEGTAEVEETLVPDADAGEESSEPASVAASDPGETKPESPDNPA
jgi:small subunit ribosomal protein S2